MALKMFDALLPYFGGKRKLCPVIFGLISKHIPREQWQGKVFIDAFLGSGAVSLYAKAQGFKVSVTPSPKTVPLPFGIMVV